MGNGTVRTSGLTPHYIHDVFILGLGQTMARRICDILDVVGWQLSLSLSPSLLVVLLFSCYSAAMSLSKGYPTVLQCTLSVYDLRNKH